MLHVMHVIRYMRHVAAALPPPLPLSAPPPEASAPRPVMQPPLDLVDERVLAARDEHARRDGVHAR